MRKCYYKKSFDIQLKKPYHKIFGPKRSALDGLPRNIAKLFVDFVGFHLSDVTNYSLDENQIKPNRRKAASTQTAFKNRGEKSIIQFVS